MKSFSTDEVLKHNMVDDCLVILENVVLDVTKFISLHPGGRKILFAEAGQINGFEPIINNDIKQNKQFTNNIVPFGDASWCQRFHSPYYKETHIIFRNRTRELLEAKVKPHISEFEESNGMSRDKFKEAASYGGIAISVGQPQPTEYTDISPPKDYDVFHELIQNEEFAGIGSAGVVWIFGSLVIGFPPLLHFGSNQLKDKYCRSILSGDKLICLAISEPYAGSDIANLQTFAESYDNYYIINGAKKWITMGLHADYQTTVVRTGAKGPTGLSFILIEKDTPGISVRHMKCTGVLPSGTAYIIFEDVKVSKDNVIGLEDWGFMQIMMNFNHERWNLAITSLRLARVAYDETFKYACQRKTFGKYLIQHQAVRFKLAHMARQIESSHAQLELITQQFKMMNNEESLKTLGDICALLKVHCGKVLEKCARDSLHIFGGRGQVRGGQGEIIERIYRDAQAFCIPGGSEDVLIDFAARSMSKRQQKKANL